MQRRLRGDDGQTSAEYVGVLAVIALLVGAIALTNPMVGSLLSDGLRTAICLVTQGDCETAAANPWEPTTPCTRVASGGRGGADVHIGVVDIGGGQGFIIEEKSDGTVHVTLYADGKVGASTGVGGGVSISTGGSTKGGSAEARAGIEGEQRAGQTVVFDDRDAAGQYVQDKMLDAGIDVLPPGVREGAQLGRWVIDKVTGHETPEGREESTQSQTSIQITGEAKAGMGPGGTITQAAAGAAYERRTETSTGHTTYSFDLTGALGSDADVALTANLGIGGDGLVGARLKVDENGNPIEFELVGEFGGRVDFDLADTDADVGDVIEELELSADHNASTTVKASLTLDLTKDPAHAAAVSDFLNSVGSADLAGARSSGAQVWDALVADSTLSVTTYDAVEGSYGAEARGRYGIGLGAGIGVDTSSEVLTGAWFFDRNTGQLVPWTGCTGGGA